MKTIIALFTLLSITTAQAGVLRITCQVQDHNGAVIAKTRAFAARSKHVQPLKVGKDEIIYIRWKFYKSPVKVAVTLNPYYPWNLPFGTKVLDRGTIDLNNKSDFVDLSIYENGLTLTCEKVAR